MNWTTEIARAGQRIGPYAHRTPVVPAPSLGHGDGAEVWAKCEHLQATGSFKLRGATNRLLALTGEERGRGVVAASSGNHGAAVAWAAAALGVRATVFVPHGASPAKVDKIRAHGAEVVFFGTDGLDTELEARGAAGRAGAAYISPYNDAAVIAGQGTVGLELSEQVSALDRVYVAVGGGGLIGGIAAWYAHASPSTRIIGALPEHSPVMAASMAAGHIVEMPSLPTLSDGTAGGIEPGAITFPLCQAHVHEWVTVSELEIGDAMRAWATGSNDPIEGAAGVAIAALRRDRERIAGQRVAVVICGGNIPPDTWVGVVGGARGTGSGG